MTVDIVHLDAKSEQIQAGRYFVLVSLREAEHIRGALHVARRAGANGRLPGKLAGLALRLLPSGDVLEASPGHRPSPGKFQAAAATQVMVSR